MTRLAAAVERCGGDLMKLSVLEMLLADYLDAHQSGDRCGRVGGADWQL